MRGEAAQNQLCGLAGYEMAFSQAELKKLYKDKKDYMRRVERSLDEATRQGWFLPVCVAAGFEPAGKSGVSITRSEIRLYTVAKTDLMPELA